MATEQSSPKEARLGFRAISAELRARIQSGHYAVGSFLPAEREFQEEFGASRTTIRRALADLVEQGWAETSPNRGVVAARGFRRAPGKRIAFIDSGSFVAGMLRETLEPQIVAMGGELVHLGGSADYPMEYAFQHAMDNGFSAALVWPYRGFPDREVMGQAARQLPMIALDHRLEEVDCDLVTFDHEQAAYDATTQLIRQGSRRIGVTGMLDMLDVTHDRFRGYLRAMFAHGLQPEPQDFLFIATSGHDQPDPAALEVRLRSGDRPEAFVILQDHCAAAVVGAAIRAGLTVPEDLKVAALGSDYAVTVDDRALTAVAFDWESLAEQALGLLMDRLQHLHRPAQVRTAPHRLFVRGLCGAPPEEWSPGAPASAPKSHIRFTSRWAVEHDRPIS